MENLASKMIQRCNAMKPEEYAHMLAQIPADKWAALSEDESSIVAIGRTMEEALSAAAEKGVAEPILVKSPEKWVQMVY
jgi:hypothetical protein